MIKFNNFFLKNLNSILLYQSIFESFLNPYKFYFIKKILTFSFSFFFSYKKTPLKLLIEDPNRTSLQLKYSLPLIKTSQSLFLNQNLI